VRNRFGVEKHGTMTAFFKGYANKRGRWDAEHRLHRPEGVLWNFPIPLGNMQFGEVVEAGPTSGRRVGDLVSAWGSFQSEAVLPGNQVFPLANGRDWRDAMMLDPGEFALGAVRDGHVRPGEWVAVFGLGAIGLATVQMARAAGAERILGIDPVPARREVALRHGASEVIDPVGIDAGYRIRELTNWQGVDVAIDFSGSLPAFQAMFRAVGYGGTLVCGAFPPPFGAGLDLGGEAHMNRPRVVFSRACSDPNPEHPRWSHARITSAVRHLIELGRLSGLGIIDEPIPFESLPEVYPRIAAAPGESIKLSVRYAN
jgi:threonine dehydrogenase-like Zn-dependent dehydrogenase